MLQVKVDGTISKCVEGGMHTTVPILCVARVPRPKGGAQGRRNEPVSQASAPVAATLSSNDDVTHAVGATVTTV